MAEEEIENVVHIRPACAECTHRCNMIHRNKDLEEENFDPDRSWPHFGKKVTRLALHHSPQAALCIPGTFSEEYPYSIPKDMPITLKGPSGNKWTVRATDRSVLYTGWRAFAHDHRLREGDQLHFRLTKSMHFDVDIFNSHGEVRRSAKKATVTGKYGASSAPPLKDQSRKRKVDLAELAGTGKCKPAKKGKSFCEPAATLKFSEETKEWENREAKRGNADPVETIDLDSDDEKTPARASELERFFGQNKEEEGDEDSITMQSTPFATQAGEDKNVIHDAKRHEEINRNDHIDQENEHSDEEEEEQRPSDDPLRQFSKLFNTTRKVKQEDRKETTEGTAEKAVIKAQNFESESDPLVRRVQTLRDEDMVTVKEEKDDDEQSEVNKTTTQACVNAERKLDTAVPEQDTTPDVDKKHKDMKADKVTQKATFLRTGQHSGISDNHQNDEAQEYFETPLTYEDTAGDYAPISEDKAVDSSPMTIQDTIKAMSKMYEGTEDSKPEVDNDEHIQSPSPDRTQDEDRAFPFDIENVEYPVITDTMKGGQTDGMEPPPKEGLNQVCDDVSLPEIEDDEDLMESKGSYSTFKAHEASVIKADHGPEKEENQNIPELRVSKQGEATLLPSRISAPEDFKTPEKANNNKIQVKVAEEINTCRLASKRWQILPIHRQRALKLAKACARKSRNPNFMAVMESSQVYTDFIMDIPSTFAKESNLPSHDVRVTLVCDEVPTNCKAYWLGSRSRFDSKGWRNFSRNHTLEEDDVCVFECLPAASVRIRVSIFRAVKLNKAPGLDWTDHYIVLQGDDAIDGAATVAAAPAANPATSPPPSPSTSQAA